MNTIYFYAPNQDTQNLLEQDFNQWVGRSTNFIGWIAQTYFHLKKAGLPCEIINRIPDSGIVLSDRDTLGDSHKFLGDVMVICAKSDREYHPSAHLHIVHNPFDVKQKRDSIWNPYYISHWPMPNLIPRPKERNCLVENVAYIGARSQLAKELESEIWINSLSSLGCKWLPILNQNKWNDYSQLDIIVAARSFDQINYPNKGLIKLINCWRAGIPAILTAESSFMAERRTELDFIVVNSLEEAIQAVKKVKNDPDLYLAMVKNGLERAKEFTQETTLIKWIEFFEKFAFPAYEEWCKTSSNQKKMFFLKRYLSLKLNRTKTRINSWL